MKEKKEVVFSISAGEVYAHYITPIKNAFATLYDALDEFTYILLAFKKNPLRGKGSEKFVRYYSGYGVSSILYILFVFAVLLTLAFMQ